MGVGLVASLAKPGGNFTGFTAQQDEVLGKLIGILHEMSPGARRIAILLNGSTASAGHHGHFGRHVLYRAREAAKPS